MGDGETADDVDNEVLGEVEDETGNTLNSTVSVVTELPFLSVTSTKTWWLPTDEEFVEK